MGEAWRQTGAMLRLFTGFDQREAVGWHVFAQSLIATDASGISITVLGGDQKNGSNAFTYSRFVIPRLCNWAGPAIFVDGSDMVLRAPISELMGLYDPKYAVQVVKHDYQTKFPRKYLGTEMETTNESYKCKNWSSVMLINCSHTAHFNAREQIDEAMERGDGKYLHRFGWLKPNEIGELPVEWNWLADEYGPNEKAKLLHWTAGIPGIESCKRAPQAQAWQYYKAMSQQSPNEIYK